MITVRLEVDRRGRLRGVDAYGHAGLGAPGGDPACAAVTGLLRTTARLLAGDRRYVVSGRAEEPGRLTFTVATKGVTGKGRLRTVADFLFQGVRDVARDYPGAVTVEETVGGE
ncbi:MAG: ribosomal-processing cysteine protease Prp [Spirochaetota bacterium]